MDELTSLKEIYGLNSTDLPDKGIIKLLTDEVLSPFYIF
jgi:hypothetical protein